MEKPMKKYDVIATCRKTQIIETLISGRTKDEADDFCNLAVIRGHSDKYLVSVVESEK